MSACIKQCPPTPFDINQLHLVVALSRERFDRLCESVIAKRAGFRSLSGAIRIAARHGTRDSPRVSHHAFDSRLRGRPPRRVWCPAVCECAPATQSRRWSFRRPLQFRLSYATRCTRLRTLVAAKPVRFTPALSFNSPSRERAANREPPHRKYV
jgi:hypothetical protein